MLCTLAILLITIGPRCTIFAAEQQNIVFIIADDMGFNDVSFRGRTSIKTPNIDELAESGVVLNRHYGLPSCSPSRSALMTGLHPIRLGMQGYPMKAGERGGIPLDKKLLPEYLKELGYSTHLVGKWHLGFETEQYLPQNRGFDSFLGYYAGYIDYYELDTNQTVASTGETFYGFDFHDEMGPRRDLASKYATETFTQEAVKIIKESKSPFFLMVSHLAAHTGTVVGDGLQVPKTNLFKYNDLSSTTRYAKIVDSIDRSVGTIRRALVEAGHADDTMIVFLSDNGGPTVALDMHPNYSSNFPLRGVKFTLFDGGVRTNAIIHSSQLNPGIENNFVHLTDWLPTLVAAAGGSVEGLDGENQWISKFNEISKRNILLNIDEKEATEGIILNSRWKVVKQRMREYGNYDGHFQTENDEVNLTEDNLLNNRNEYTINCTPTSTEGPRWVQPSTDFLCSDYCVFDVLNDPCELKPLKNSEILAEGIALLDEWRTALIPQRSGIVDYHADPQKFNNVWSPWRLYESSCNAKSATSRNIDNLLYCTTIGSLLT